LHLQDYIQLVDITGRVIRENKRGFIDNNLPPILDRLKNSPREWLVLTTQLGSKFKSLMDYKVDPLALFVKRYDINGSTQHQASLHLLL
jgi:hypothetical protein